MRRSVREPSTAPSTVESRLGVDARQTPHAAERCYTRIRRLSLRGGDRYLRSHALEGK